MRILRVWIVVVLGMCRPILTWSLIHNIKWIPRSMPEMAVAITLSYTSRSKITTHRIIHSIPQPTTGLARISSPRTQVAIMLLRASNNKQHSSNCSNNNRVHRMGRKLRMWTAVAIIIFSITSKKLARIMLGRAVKRGCKELARSDFSLW